MRLAIVAGERGHGGVLSGIKILRQLDRLNMLVGRYGSRLVHRLARIFQRDDHFLVHRVRRDVLDARLPPRMRRRGT